MLEVLVAHLVAGAIAALAALVLVRFVGPEKVS